MALTYLDFELEIGLAVDGAYPVAVIKSPAGETRTALRWPFSELQLENRLKDLQNLELPQPIQPLGMIPCVCSECCLIVIVDEVDV